MTEQLVCGIEECRVPATVKAKNHDEPDYNHRCYNHRQDF